nr:MAG TPA: portal vertex protein [Caudoviricetes sp.]
MPHVASCVDTAVVFLPVDGQVIQTGDQQRIRREERRTHGLQATHAFLADDHIGSQFFTVFLLFVDQREILVRQQFTTANHHQTVIVLVNHVDKLIDGIHHHSVQVGIFATFPDFHRTRSGFTARGGAAHDVIRCILTDFLQPAFVHILQQRVFATVGGFRTLHAVKADHDAVQCLTFHDGVTDAHLEILKLRPQIQLRVGQHRVKVGLLAFIFHIDHQGRIGEVIALEPALAKYTRRGLDLDTYWFVQYGMTTQPYQFTKGSIFHLMEPDINQEIYGLPGYLSAIPSALLNESATLFRRKYYINGSHAGFIMYMTDAAQNQEDVNNLRNAMKSAKGPGNFRNLFMYSPNGKKDGLQIIPLSEVAAKDEFLNIKNVSRDDMMAAHRVPPQMMGIMPNNVGGFGDVEKASKVFVINELIPLQKRFREINAWLGEKLIEFSPYELN